MNRNASQEKSHENSRPAAQGPATVFRYFTVYLLDAGSWLHVHIFLPQFLIVSERRLAPQSLGASALS
jgi:hypothetical protein